VKVLVVPEDPMLDQYILNPVVERLFADLGLSARVDVLWKPRLRSVNQALDPSMVRHVIGTFSMIDLFLLTVDRDADEHRAKRARTLETEHPGRLFACLAVEEVEVWMLALHRDRLPSRWAEIRGERGSQGAVRASVPCCACTEARCRPGAQMGDARPRCPLEGATRCLPRDCGAEGPHRCRVRTASLNGRLHNRRQLSMS
jgi:hypothetical protein